MKETVKRYSLVFCLFTFLFVVVGGGFHLNPGGAFLAALSGTPLIIYAFNHRFGAASVENLRTNQSIAGVEGYGSGK